MATPVQPAEGRAHVVVRVGRLLALGDEGRIENAGFGLFCQCDGLTIHDRPQAALQRQLLTFARQRLIAGLEDEAPFIRTVAEDGIGAEILHPIKAGDDLAPVRRMDADPPLLDLMRGRFHDPAGDDIFVCPVAVEIDLVPAHCIERSLLHLVAFGRDDPAALFDDDKVGRANLVLETGPHLAAPDLGAIVRNQRARVASPEACGQGHVRLPFKRGMDGIHTGRGRLRGAGEHQTESGDGSLDHPMLGLHSAALGVWARQRRRSRR